MGKVRGLPGTPEVEALEHGHQESEEEMAQKAADKGWSNSHANLMNEGDDDGWPDSWKRHQIEERKRDRSADDVPTSDDDY